MTISKMNALHHHAAIALRRRYPWRVNFFNESITKQDIAFIDALLAGGEPLDEGPAIEAYEDAFARSLGGGEAISFGAGRMALYAILTAFGIGPGDEVIIPAFTCSVVVRAVAYTGARLVYCDIDPVRLVPTPRSVGARITGATKAVLAQHAFGVACDVDGIRAMLPPQAFVIEDCALAQGSASMDGRPLGTLGDAALFSTDWTKVASTMRGGMAFTRDAPVAGRLREIQRRAAHLPVGTIQDLLHQIGFTYRWHGPLLDPFAQAFVSRAFRGGRFYMFRDAPSGNDAPADYPCRLSAAQAALGLRQIARLETNIRARQDRTDRYVEAFAENGIPANPAWSSARLRFPILLRDRKRFIRRWKPYLDVGTWFDAPAWGSGPAGAHDGYRIGSCPDAERVHGTIINLPTLPRTERLDRFLTDVARTLRPDDLVMPWT